MSTTRPWPYPDLRNGTTIHHITDTHFGAEWDAPFVYDWLTRTQADVERLKVATNGGHVHTGDMGDNWFDSTDLNVVAQHIAQQEAAYRSWRDGIKAVDGLPFAEAPGNHDLFGNFSAPGASGATPRAGRSSADWAESMGLHAINNAYSMRDVRVLTLAPDWWYPGDNPDLIPYQLSQATCDWLDAQLSADSRPTFLAAHVPLLEQYGNDGDTGDGATPRVAEIIGSHSNVAGWLSGHRHDSMTGNPEQAEVITVAGRQIFAVCGPAAAGGCDRFVAHADHQWQSTNISIWMTLLDDQNLDVRWRDHNSRQWTHVPGGQSVWTTRHTLLTKS
jgi:hypothetical protein